MENFFNTVFNFNEFIFVYVVNIRFICDGEIYLLTYLIKTLKYEKYVVVIALWRVQYGKYFRGFSYFATYFTSL